MPGTDTYYCIYFYVFGQNQQAIQIWSAHPSQPVGHPKERDMRQKILLQETLKTLRMSIIH